MERIVTKALKIDLHIHSVYSSHKEAKGLVSNNTEANLPLLLKKLNKDGVNVVAITDHDVFSYSMYSALKKHEGEGSLIKVFPGIEFSVCLANESKGEWPVHVIAIFDDIDDTKIRNIENVVGNRIPKMPYDSNSSYYSEKVFLSILKEIDIDVVLIAHQKHSLPLDRPIPPQKNDLNGVGETFFNEYLFSEYFQSLEFKERNNELFNKRAKARFSGDLLRFITGSDCHDWSVYPKHDPDLLENEFKHTYLKCLPCFKGLALALTEDSRINLTGSFFSASDAYLPSIDLIINGMHKAIPLSRGINAIIGDNSIGKSLLLHKLTGYMKANASLYPASAINEKIKQKYEDYLDKNQIAIDTQIDERKIWFFDSQGEVRRKFVDGVKGFDSQNFIKSLSASNPYISPALDKALAICKEYFNGLRSISGFPKALKTLDSAAIKIYDRDLVATTIKVEAFSVMPFSDEKAATHLKKQATEKAINALKEIMNFATEDEVETIENAIKVLDGIRSRVTNEIAVIQNKIDVISIINAAASSFNDDQPTTDDDKEIAVYNLQKAAVASSIFNVIKAKTETVSFANPHIPSEITIPAERIEYGNYKIVSSSKTPCINDAFLATVFSSPLKKNKFKKESFESDEALAEAISNNKGNDPWDFYWERIEQLLKDTISEVILLNKLDEPDAAEHSIGLDQRMYFRVMTSDRTHPGIYIIDQPEDDISQTSIRDELISSIRKMAEYRQVFLVTHNPQFVVNLDADNVISLKKDEEGITIGHGALEYKDAETDILKEVANTLDGGALTIRKRWKKYEKKIDDILG